MITPKCPVAGCNSTGFQKVLNKDINLLVCDSGHVISRDYSDEMKNLAHDIGLAVTGVATDVKSQAQAIGKTLKEIKEVVAAPATPPSTEK